MDAPPVSRDYLERQLARVKRVIIISYIFTLLAFPLLIYGMATSRFGVVAAGAAWFLISLFQRYRALRLRLRLEEHLRAQDVSPHSGNPRNGSPRNGNSRSL